MIVSMGAVAPYKIMELDKKTMRAQIELSFILVDSLLWVYITYAFSHVLNGTNSLYQKHLK